jgi:hypothetical protein
MAAPVFITAPSRTQLLSRDAAKVLREFSVLIVTAVGEVILGVFSFVILVVVVPPILLFMAWKFIQAMTIDGLGMIKTFLRKRHTAKAKAATSPPKL